MNNLINIAQQFINKEKIIEITELGTGNINHTFLVTVDSKQNSNFVLQQVNTQVFIQPELVMNNIEAFVTHANCKLKNNSLFNNRSWKIPQIVYTLEQKNHYIDKKNNFWRAISYIENAQSYDIVKDSKHAYEIGYGLGIFHNLISDLDTTQLADTLPEFHVTPIYLQHYRAAIQQSKAILSTETHDCHSFIEEKTNIVDILEEAKQQDILKLRPIHGDPKINNIMINNHSKQAIAMVDLDTIKPGLIHYDIGDCLRSGCNILGEETQKIQLVTFDLDLAREILKGYLTVAKSFITPEEIHYIYDSIRLITFELGLRFFTDYLNNNIYFKTQYPEHNLQRALVQFQLVKSIESQEKAIKKIITQVAK